MYLSRVTYWTSDAVQLPLGVTHPLVVVPGHVPGREPGGHLISSTVNISFPETARKIHAISTSPITRTTEYIKKLLTNPAYDLEFCAANSAVPVQRPSIKPPPFFIYLNARKESCRRLERLKKAQLLWTRNKWNLNKPQSHSWHLWCWSSRVW